MSELTYANIEDILTKCFLQQWNNETPVILKNQLQEEVEDDVEAWVRFSVLRTASAQDSFGGRTNRRFLRLGRIFVQVFVKSGTITSRQNELCSKIIDMYENCNVSGLRIIQILQQDMPDGATRTAKVTGDGKWFGTMINVQFAFDEIK